ncbi:MAG: amidohydrolase [Alsobacter sp.]
MCRWCARSDIADRLTARISPSRRQFLGYTASLAVMGPGLAARAATGVADTIFHKGPIYPMTAPGAKVEAIALQKGAVLAAGSSADVMALAGPTTKTIDLSGRTLLPGFIDPHNHATLSALVEMLLTNVGFSTYRTKADALAAMKAVAAKTAPGDWIAFGFYDNLLQGGDISMADLDAVSSTSPVFLMYVNGHVGAGNALAFARAKVTADIGTLPGGGFFGRGADGKLNGMIYNEPALLRFLDLAVARPNAESLARAIGAYARQASASGLTALHEPGTVKPEWVEMLAKLSNSLPVRLSASFSTDMVEASKAFAKLGPSHKARRLPDSRFSLYGMKFWADGSNQAETAAQTQPYLRSSARGALGYTPQQAADLCGKARDAGWTILVHCQGDAAVDQVLDAIETAYGAHSSLGLNRIEHATMARPDQIDRMKRLGCEASYMTDFVYLYGAAYRDQIFGEPRASFMVPVGAAARAGMGYSMHTDNPAAGLPLNPLRLVQTVVTRRCVTDGSVVGPDLRMSVEEALLGITKHAARHIGLDDAIGTLEAGKEADLTILETDPFVADPERLAAIRVSETWLAGEKAFG